MTSKEIKPKGKKLKWGYFIPEIISFNPEKKALEIKMHYVKGANSLFMFLFLMALDFVISFGIAHFVFRTKR